VILFPIGLLSHADDSGLFPEARSKLIALSWEEIHLALMLDIGSSHAMADVDDGQAFRTKLSNHLEQPIRSMARESVSAEAETSTILMDAWRTTLTN
jgi:hypothetical protein